MRMLLKSASSIVVSVAMAVAVSGCRGYQSGSLMHDQVKTVSVGRVVNQSEDASFGALLRQKVVEELVRDGSVIVRPQGKAQATMRLRLLPYQVTAVASARRRGEDTSNRDRNTYQSEVFRAEVAVEVRLEIPGRDKAAVEWKRVTGSAEFSRLSDIPESRRDAMETALTEAARKAVLAVVEAW